MVRIRVDYWSLCKNNEIRIHIKWMCTCVRVCVCVCFGNKGVPRQIEKHMQANISRMFHRSVCVDSQWKISPVLIIITIMPVMTFPSEKPQGNTCGSIQLCLCFLFFAFPACLFHMPRCTYGVLLIRASSMYTPPPHIYSFLWRSPKGWHYGWLEPKLWLCHLRQTSWVYVYSSHWIAYISASALFSIDTKVWEASVWMCVLGSWWGWDGVPCQESTAAVN